MAGIRDFIKNELGLTGEEKNIYDRHTSSIMSELDFKTETLIRGYSESHERHVNPHDIVNDVRTTAGHIVDNLPFCVSGYDFNHEVNECGKQREFNAIQSVGGDSARECLPYSFSANDVGAWSAAIYDTAKNIFEDRAFGNGIEGYREFVKEMPYGNIHSTAEALGEQTETVKFIAENGDSRDFRNFMIDIRPNAETKFPDEPFAEGDYGVTVHGCPRELSDRIFDVVKGMSDSGALSWFDRDAVMSGLSAIHNEKTMTDDEKMDLQNEYIENRLDHRVSPLFESFLKADVEDKYETMSSFLKESNGLSVDKQEELVYKAFVPDAQDALNEKYDALVTSLKEDRENRTLTLEDISAKIRESGFNEILGKYDEGHDIFLNTYPGGELLVEGSYCKATHNDIRVTVKADELSSIVHEAEDKVAEKDTEKIEAVLNGNIDHAERWGNTWSLHEKDDPDGKPVILREGSPLYNCTLTVRSEKLDSNGGIRNADTRIGISENETKDLMEKIKSLAPDKIAEHDVSMKEDYDTSKAEYVIDGRTILADVNVYSFHTTEEGFEWYCAQHPEKMGELAENGTRMESMEALREYVYGSDASKEESEKDMKNDDYVRDEMKDLSQKINHHSYDIDEDEDYDDDNADEPTEIFTLEMDDDPEDFREETDENEDESDGWYDPVD